MDGRRSVIGTESESEREGHERGGGIVSVGVYTNHPHVVHPLHPNNPNNFQNPNASLNSGNPNCNYTPNSVNSTVPFTATATFAPPFHPHPQALTTIRVTPVEGTATSSDGGSDCQSVASSSRESTLRRKSGSNINYASDRGPTPDIPNSHSQSDNGNSNRFQENLRSFQENTVLQNQPNHPNRQLQGLFGRPSPTPPPTLPRPILTHTPPPTLGLAYKE